MIKFATDSDRERIIELWTDTFGDSRESVECFLKYFPCNNALGRYVNNELVSFMFLPELWLDYKGEKYRTNYIYALCTAPEYRSNGYASELIDYSKNYSAKNNIPYTLIRPGTERLFSYYSHRGFEREYCRIKKNLTIDSNLLYNNMNSDLPDVAFAQWGDDGLGYSLKCGIEVGCYAPCFDKAKGERYIMLRRNLEGVLLFENVFMELTFE